MELNIKNLFKASLLFILLSFPIFAMANTVSEALNASKNNENKEAVKIWTQLAKAGNTIAKYNLAGHYSKGKGVVLNKQLAYEWLQDATRAGLVQAYLNLSNKALSSANGLQLSFNSGPLHWLKEQEPKQYTIQLASSRNEKSIAKVYDDNQLKGKGGYYHYVRAGVDRYALIYGAYKSVAQANAAIANLPEKLRKKTPWVRKIGSLQKISK